MRGGSDSPKAHPAGDGPVNIPIYGASGMEARPSVRMRARRWNPALLAAVAAVAALSEPSGASPGQAVERAIVLVAEGRLGEARKVLEPVLDLRPDHPRAQLLDGILHAREGHVDQAIEVFERLSREHPEMPEPWNNLAVLLAVKGRLLDARDALEEALARRPGLAVAHANLGDVYDALARHSHMNAEAPEPSPSAEGMATREHREQSQVPGPEEPPPRMSVTPSLSGSATASAPSSSAVEPIASQALASGVPEVDGSVSLAKPKADRERWQRFLSLPHTPFPATIESSADVAASAADHTPPRELEGVSDSVATCFLATGFETPHAAAEAGAWLRSRGLHNIEFRREERSAPRNHRVYLPPLGSRAAAVAAVNEIRARGIRDVAIISAGPLRNGVSLGVYRKAKNALRRVVQMEGLGYRVRHAPRETGIAEYQIAARASGDAFLQLRAAWKERFPGRSLGFADCG